MEERNARIRDLWERGASGTVIGHHYDISRQRVDQIVHPDRHRARQLAYDHLQGYSEPCEICGSPDTEIHHSEYGKPLEVNWYCSPCHGMQHRGDIRRQDLMKGKQRNTELVTIRMPESLKALIEAEAIERAVSISTIVRWALSERYDPPIFDTCMGPGPASALYT